eukprot:scaffold107_cov106-Isochrysis_galbana.AAC.21
MRAGRGRAMAPTEGACSCITWPAESGCMTHDVCRLARMVGGLTDERIRRLSGVLAECRIAMQSRQEQVAEEQAAEGLKVATAALTPATHCTAPTRSIDAPTDRFMP